MTDTVRLRRHRSARRPHWVTHIALIIGAVMMVGPFAWEVLVSFKTFAESQLIPATFIPHKFVWSNYPDVFKEIPFARFLLNTLISALAQTAGQVVFCSLAGYAFARLRFRGSQLVFGMILSTMMIPGELFLLPRYEIMQKAGLLDTLPALFLPDMFGGAFGIFLMRQFFMQLPKSLDDAAHIDGAGPVRIFTRIAVPLATPAMFALAIMTAVSAWTQLLWPLIVNTDPNKMPLSAGLATFQGQYYTNYPLLMAGSIMASLPMIGLFVVFQRRFLQGINLAGVQR